MSEKNIDILQNLEFAVNQIWKQQPDISDAAVARGYEAVFNRYRAENRGHTPKPPSVTGVELDICHAVSDICEWRLGRKAENTALAAIPTPATLEEIVDCLRRLMKSVERHSQTGGRQGYLKFIAQFL